MKNTTTNLSKTDPIFRDFCEQCVRTPVGQYYFEGYDLKHFQYDDYICLVWDNVTVNVKKKYFETYRGDVIIRALDVLHNNWDRLNTTV
jgi:hypothetical protein